MRRISTRRAWIEAVSAASTCLALLACSEEASVNLVFAEQTAPTRRHNVVLVVVDTLRADHLSCYGYPRETSPRLDRFAAGAVRFERAYTAWPETCPSMAAMLSGMSCQANGVIADTPRPISRKLDVLPEILQREGWKTAAFVTNGVLPRTANYDQGFDHYVQAWNKDENQGKSDVQLACNWVHENAESPFFVWLHVVEPHAPYAAREPEKFVGDRWYDPTRRVEVRPPERRFEAVGGIPGFSRIEGRDELAYYVARYDAEICDSDSKFGRILDQIEREGLSDRTMVIFVADHGEGLGEHDYYWHGVVPYDETAHVPLLIRAPGIAAGVATDVVSTIDVMPTVLEFLQVPIPASCEGRSLFPLLRAPATRTDRVVFTESGDDQRDRNWQRTARDRRFKLVYVPSARERELLGLDEWSLFDLENDPGETKNVLAEHPEDADRLKAELFAWMRSDSLYDAPQGEYSPEDLEAIRQTDYATDDGREDEDKKEGHDEGGMREH